MGDEADWNRTRVRGAEGRGIVEDVNAKYTNYTKMGGGGGGMSPARATENEGGCRGERVMSRE